MERLRPRYPALPVDAPYHNHIHVVGRYIHVGSFRDFRQFLLDKRGYSDGRLRINDRADDGLPATVQETPSQSDKFDVVGHLRFCDHNIQPGTSYSRLQRYPLRRCAAVGVKRRALFCKQSAEKTIFIRTFAI